MPRELTIMLVRDSGQAPFTLRLGAWSVLVVGALALVAALVCLWAGFQIGELTFSL
jgi:hypothetical protein